MIYNYLQYTLPHGNILPFSSIEPKSLGPSPPVIGNKFHTKAYGNFLFFITSRASASFSPSFPFQSAFLNPNYPMNNIGRGVFLYASISLF